MGVFSCGRLLLLLPSHFASCPTLRPQRRQPTRAPLSCAHVQVTGLSLLHRTSRGLSRGGAVLSAGLPGRAAQGRHGGAPISRSRVLQACSFFPRVPVLELEVEDSCCAGVRQRLSTFQPAGGRSGGGGGLQEWGGRGLCRSEGGGEVCRGGDLQDWGRGSAGVGGGVSAVVGGLQD